MSDDKVSLLDHVTEVGGELEDQAADAATTLAFIERRLKANDNPAHYTHVATTAVATLLGTAMAQILKDLRGKHPQVTNLVGIQLSDPIWELAAVICSGSPSTKPNFADTLLEELGQQQ